MVRGLGRFREFFEGYQDRYVLIEVKQVCGVRHQNLRRCPAAICITMRVWAFAVKRGRSDDTPEVLGWSDPKF